MVAQSSSSSERIENERLEELLAELDSKYAGNYTAPQLIREQRSIVSELLAFRRASINPTSATDLGEVTRVLEMIDAELADHGYAEIGTLRATVRNTISALSSVPTAGDGWMPIDSADKSDGVVIIGWGEYRERDGFSPAFMRWYDDAGGWIVTGMPFYPTHWMTLPSAPKP